MKNKLIFTAAFFALWGGMQAQNKYNKIAYSDVSVEAKEMTVIAKDVVSTKEYTKFNLKIANKGDDILLYKPEESTLKANNKDYKPQEKWLVIPPTDMDNRVVNVKGNEFMISAYSYVVDGVYKVSDHDKSIETADFQLPPSQNEFKTGNFTCNLIDLNKETDKTAAKFECRYTGSKFGVINPSRAAIKLPDGTEIANSKTKPNPMILAKGESEKFTLVWKRMEGGKATDMQKINLMIVWRSTFVESDATKINPVTIDFKIDESRCK